jgi:hypothetical protein
LEGTCCFGHGRDLFQTREDIYAGPVQLGFNYLAACDVGERGVGEERRDELRSICEGRGCESAIEDMICQEGSNITWIAGCSGASGGVQELGKCIVAGCEKCDVGCSAESRHKGRLGSKKTWSCQYSVGKDGTLTSRSSLLIRVLRVEFSEAKASVMLCAEAMAAKARWRKFLSCMMRE